MMGSRKMSAAPRHQIPDSEGRLMHVKHSIWVVKGRKNSTISNFNERPLRDVGGLHTSPNVALGPAFSKVSQFR